MKRRVLGLDVSANRIAWGICDSVDFYGSCLVPRRGRGFDDFVCEAHDRISNATIACKSTAACIEINLHPKVVHKGHVSPKMIRAYMRSRWVEGAILAKLGLDEPTEMKRMKGNYIEVEAGRAIYSLAATWQPKAKEMRRHRMLALYAHNGLGDLSEDEIDALAIAHDCAVALNLAGRGVVSGK